MRLLRALVVALLLALVVRGFVAVPRRVPTGSMMPALMPGDVFLAVRWPLGAPFAQRFHHGLPQRGEIVIARGVEGDVVKRVIGLPGDSVAIRSGTVILNDAPVARFRVADYLGSPVEIGGCARDTIVVDGHALCRVRRYREQLADGRSWDTLDLGQTEGDEMAPHTVPAGHLFLLGDNRDRSGDSRFPAGPGGLGFVDTRAVGGTARVILWSFAGDATLADPAGWWRASRRERTGLGLSRR